MAKGQRTVGFRHRCELRRGNSGVCSIQLKEVRSFNSGCEAVLFCSDVSDCRYDRKSKGPRDKSRRTARVPARGIGGVRGTSFRSLWPRNTASLEIFRQGSNRGQRHVPDVHYPVSQSPALVPAACSDPPELSPPQRPNKSPTEHKPSGGLRSPNRIQTDLHIAEEILSQRLTGRDEGKNSVCKSVDIGSWWKRFTWANLWLALGHTWITSRSCKEQKFNRVPRSVLPKGTFGEIRAGVDRERRERPRR